MVNPKTTFSEKESSYLILGLDIGIGSCGWCIPDRASSFIAANTRRKSRRRDRSRAGYRGTPPR